MRRSVEDEQVIRHYLLGDLSPEERQRLEERLLDDNDDFYEQVQLAEAELADDYVTGDLPDAERTRFKETFLSTPGGYEQLRFTELLRKHFAASEPLKKTVTAEARPPSSLTQRVALWLGLGKPAVGFALACGLILAVTASALLGFRAWQLGRRLEQLQAQPAPPSNDAETVALLRQQLEEERARRESASRELAHEQEQRSGLEREVARLKEEGRREPATNPPTERAGERPTRRPPPDTNGTVLALMLTSGAVREAGQWKTLVLTPEATTVRLNLDIGTGDFKSYRAALRDIDGKTLLTKAALRPSIVRDGIVVVFNVPARLLSDGGDFQVQLSGVTHDNAVEDVSRYNFRVARR